MLLDLTSKIAQAPAPQIDPEADQLIKSQIGQRPDALYLLTQTVIIQNLALDRARQQIQQLQQQASQPQQPRPGTSFLGQQPPPLGATPYGAPPPQYSAPAPQPSSGGGSSFLRSAATTAAGVAAGALAFEGIRSLFGGVEHVFGFGSPHLSSFLGGGVPGVADPGIDDNIATTDDSDVSDDADTSTSPDDSDDSSDSDDSDNSDDSSYDDSSDDGGSDFI